MRGLPQDFLLRMKQQLKEEYSDFIATYDNESFSGLRVNTSKISVSEFLSITPFQLTPVPWTENGFYYDKTEPVTRHPHYYAGLYYIQEPSAMLPASRLPVEAGNTVLDLCAAPGGKATELSSRLGGSGLLIANDASASRAKALVKNLTVWGSPNCCITGEKPETLRKKFGCFFDRILVDAPCSGEGMFRKDNSLIDAWEERGPQEYSILQKQILSEAFAMLRPGGYLVYSTCTFSQEEDEDVIRSMLEEHEDFQLVQPESCAGFSCGSDELKECIRLWPHKINGEGHFMALLHKKSSGDTDSFTDTKKTANNAYSAKETGSSHKKMPAAVADFMKKIPKNIWIDKYYRQIGENCYLLPGVRVPEHLRYLLTGIHIGTEKKDRFEPSQALAMLLRAEDFPASITFSSEDPRVIRYLKGETVELSEEEDHVPNGWVLVCTDSYGLGWGKMINGSIKNKFYPGWRIQ